MFRWPNVPVSAGQLGWIVVGVTAGLLFSAVLRAQSAPPQPAPQAQAAKNPYVFAADAGAILNYIKPDKTADFENTMAKLKQALATSAKPERKQQAEGWRIFKAAEPGPNGSVIYVSFMEPVAKGADYSASAVLAEAFPDQARALYDVYAAAFGQPAQNVLNLTLITSLGK